MVTVAEVFLYRALHEGVVVPDALAAAPHVVDDGPRHAALRGVVVGLEHPLAAAEGAKERALHARGAHVAVLPYGGGVVHYLVGHYGLAAVTELVLAAAAEPLAAERCRNLVGKAQLYEQRRIDQVERTCLERGLEVIGGAVGKHGAARPHVYGPGRVEVFGRLEYAALLSVVERYCLHVVEREHAEVNLSVLRIRQLYAVIEHSHVVGAHAAYVDGLYAAHAAVVLQLHAGEEPQRVGHAETVQPLQFFSLQPL